MRVYYYHTVDVGTMYKGWKEGIFPGHLLYGATHLPCHGIDVMFHQPIRPRQRWKLTLHTAWKILTCRKKYDILYATTFRGLEIIIFLRAMHLFPHPIAVWHHQPVVRAGNPLREAAARLFYKGMDLMFLFSEKIRCDSLKSEKAREERLRVTAWGADLEYYDRIMKEDGIERRNGFVSTGRENRDFPTLLSAFSDTGAPLDIYTCKEYGGANYGEMLQATSIPENIRIHFVEGLVQGELSRIVNKSGCVVICCKETNYTVGLTTLVEALALGIPVICSDNPQMPIDINACGCGIAVGYGDEKGWEKAIRFIADNPEKAREMGRKGRETAEKSLSLDICAKEVAEALKELYDRHYGNGKDIQHRRDRSRT